MDLAGQTPSLKAKDVCSAVCYRLLELLEELFAPSFRTCPDLMLTAEQIYFHEHAEETKAVGPNCDIYNYNIYISLHIVCKRSSSFQI